MNKESNKIIVRTRFAPSPTGELHLGGARTALFNYLLADEFVLRFEDTDEERNEEKFALNQYQDLLWLGLEPNESTFAGGKFGPYKQSQRLEIYQKYITELLKKKRAYYCFCSQEELIKEREEYIKKNQVSNYKYSRKCLNLNKEKVNYFLKNEKNQVIRFLVDRERNYEFSDLVRQKISFKGRDIEDFIIIRSNGLPTYNLAVVIDDHLMNISHVLRAEEHLSNTAKQLALYECLEWIPPQFGHLSIILNQERQKISKRDPLASEYQMIHKLREKGYLPSAIINYLLLLGWHPGTLQEIFSLEEARRKFDLKGLNPRGAVFSLEKLNWYNNYYIQKISEEDYKGIAWKFLQNHYLLLENQKEYAEKISLLFRSQINSFQELINLSDYFFQKPLSSLLPEEREILTKFRREIIEMDKLSEKSIKNLLEEYKKEKKLLFLRKKITGKEKGPELFKIIFLLGREKTIDYLDQYEK